jgi:DNA-binding NarL/FixJ family response regulator
MKRTSGRPKVCFILPGYADAMTRDVPGPTLLLVAGPLIRGHAKVPVAWVNGPRAQGRTRALTPRQTEVLRELASGLRTKEIAEMLHVSTKTVETHRLQIMRRLGLRAHSHLVRYALQAGILPASWLLEEFADRP